MKKLFLEMFNAENAEELNKIITSDKNFKNPNNWRPYGEGNKNNFATFENQQSEAIPALVEKITNSIDALLLKRCRIKGIDPKSKSAPLTMSQAVEMFYGIKNGDFSEVTEKDKRGIASDIQLIATGDKQSPNILSYDNGEGQHPDDFPDTFLSLLKGNKTNIPFVQGKYNMGSTGAVVFCREYRYQLIGSRRPPELLPKGKNDEFGFTIVRRHPLSEEEEDSFRSSWYEYFTVDGKIPHFKVVTLDLGLWERDFISGSIVKLYSYDLPRGSRSDIRLDLWRDLNQFLYHPALPILLYEKRFKGGHSETKLMQGNKTRLLIHDREKKEITIPLSISGHNFGSVGLEITVFKHDTKQTEFIKDKAVIFTLNGQVHGSEQRRFISQELGFSMLRDSMLIQVDCTNIKTSFRQDLFMASRDRLKGSEKKQNLIDKIINALKSNEILKEINQKRRSFLLRESSEDKDLIKTAIANLSIDKDLLNLLKKTGDLDFLRKYAQKSDSDKEKADRIRDFKSDYTSKRFPSIFKIELKDDNSGRKIKSIPLNGKGIIKFETDVEDEYLFRPKDKGEFEIQILGIKRNETSGGTEKGIPKKVEDNFEVTKEGPTNHSIKVTFEPKADISVGDEIELNARLSSPNGDLQSIFWIKIIEPHKETENAKQPPKEEPPSLPKPIKVFEHATEENPITWQEYAWTGEDIVKIISEKNILDAIAINMDCYALKRYISKNKISSPEQIKLVKDKFFLSIYFHSLFLYSILNKLGSSEVSEMKFDSEDLTPLIFKPYSSFLLSTNTDEAILASLKEE